MFCRDDDQDEATASVNPLIAANMTDEDIVIDNVPTTTIPRRRLVETDGDDELPMHSTKSKCRQLEFVDIRDDAKEFRRRVLHLEEKNSRWKYECSRRRKQYSTAKSACSSRWNECWQRRRYFSTVELHPIMMMTSVDCDGENK